MAWQKQSPRNKFWSLSNDSTIYFYTKKLYDFKRRSFIIKLSEFSKLSEDYIAEMWLKLCLCTPIAHKEHREACAEIVLYQTWLC